MREADSIAVMVEVKTSINSVEELLRTTDMKTRLLPGLVAERFGLAATARRPGPGRRRHPHEPAPDLGHEAAPRGHIPGFDRGDEAMAALARSRQTGRLVPVSGARWRGRDRSRQGSCSSPEGIRAHARRARLGHASHGWDPGQAACPNSGLRARGRVSQATDLATQPHHAYLASSWPCRASPRRPGRCRIAHPWISGQLRRAGPRRARQAPRDRPYPNRTLVLVRPDR